MLFNTWTFALFFVITFALYWALQGSHKKQNVLLLIASYVFYGWWDVHFLYLITLCTVVDYCASLMIDRGRLTVRQYTTALLFLLLSAFFCVTVNWDAVHVSLPDFKLHLDIAWASLLPKSLSGWWVLGASLAGGVAFVFLTHMTRWNYGRTPRLYLALSVCMNLLVLGVFKYYNFFAENFIHLYSQVTGSTPSALTYQIILPVGISFFTFQSISHAVDVYRKDIPAGDSLIDLAAFIAFFPQLVAGPIERGAHLLPQFQHRRTISREEWREGIWLIGWGLYKKVVIADNIARTVNGIFGPYDTLSTTVVPHDGMQCLLGLYAFAIQIYCDFSGYTDIARGTAKLLGFDILLNFNLPYFATNPSEFWKRWHISLSSWLRDYLYIPLGGNRHGRIKTYRNLIITMVLGGLWHGAAWTFVLWGAFHGTILVLFRMIRERHEQIKHNAYASFIKGVFMFNLVCFGWLLFRAQNLTTVGIFLESIVFHPHWSPLALGYLKNILLFTWLLAIFEIFQKLTQLGNPMQRLPGFVRLNVWIVIVMSLICYSGGRAQEFIYFAF